VFSSNRSGIYGLWKISTRGGEPTVIMTNSTEATEPSVTRDGELAYTDTVQNTNVWRLDLHSNDPNHPGRSSLISSSRRNDSPQYSPDGQKIVFVSDRTGSWELWVCNQDGSSPRQLTFFRGPMLGTPHWFPDGRWIAFDAEERMPSWSRDGQWLHFNSDRGGKIQLWKMHISDGKLYPLTERPAYDSFESPDASWIYFRSDGPGIWRVPTNSGEESPVPELRWVGASRYIAVVGKNFYFVAAETHRVASNDITSLLIA
jgi:Tol biopolymer transport system component